MDRGAAMTMSFAEAPGRDPMRRACDLARRHLGLDVAAIGELVEGFLVYRAIAGDGARFGIALNTGVETDSRYRRGLDEGRLLTVIPDLRAERRRTGLPMIRAGQQGAYVGVPLRLPDGMVYGSFFGLRGRPDHTLGPRDADLLSILAELLAGDLARNRARERARRDIERVLEDEDIAMAYQPIFDMTGGCRGVEALARFPVPLGPPDETFAAARDLDLSFELERLVARKVWSLLERLPDDRFLSLNLTPGAALELAHRARTRDELPLDRLVVEITEHAVVPSYGALRDALEPLRRRGLRIAIDDAGAGYASLRHVVELRPDFVKVDQSLSHGVADDHARLVAVSAFVLLALDIGASVIAEGVERELDLAALREAGVELVQGYLTAPPSLDLHKVAGWLGLSVPEMAGAIGQAGPEPFGPSPPHNGAEEAARARADPTASRTTRSSDRLIWCSLRTA
jgi:EAL domain-containing protein (putative c-di-GMP-specific phosphodiesterase class I)